ncbi:HK97 gp10 family phage protein [Mameliella alba]|nr:HK97 gp10 family phage protein [Antarctobacter heliothermus]MBY6143356.1 HK97 gp10 family phage protein [Mameliella alba]MCA0952920.1 HK97 gp10 family phage protein [Mameliella alba]
MKASFKVKGFRDLDKALSQLPKASAKAVARRILKKAGQPIADAGAAKAPKHQGHLRESYGVGTKLTRRQSKMARKESPVEVYVGPNDPAAIQTEFGNEHQAAEPHLRPAWDAHKEDALQIIADEFWQEIEKAVARYNKRQAKKGLR